MSNPTDPAGATAQPRRSYVPASYVAVACRVDVYQLDTRFRPDDWACPRDFYLSRRGALFFAEGSLPRLAATLAERGQPEAAGLLLEYAATLPAGRSASGPDELGEVKPVARVAASAEQLEEVNQAGRKRHACEREALPANWAHDWEDARG